MGGVALRTRGHSSAVVGDNIYVYGGLLEGSPTNDLMVFNTGLHPPPNNRINDMKIAAVCHEFSPFLLQWP